MNYKTLSMVFPLGLGVGERRGESAEQRKSISTAEIFRFLLFDLSAFIWSADLAIKTPNRGLEPWLRLMCWRWARNPMRTAFAGISTSLIGSVRAATCALSMRAAAHACAERNETVKAAKSCRRG